MKETGIIIGGVVLIIIGLGMIEMGISEGDPNSIFGSLLFGGIFILSGVVLIKVSITDKKYQKKARQKQGLEEEEKIKLRGEDGIISEIKSEIKEKILPGYEAGEDKTALEKRLTNFRRNYAAFFASTYAMQNAPVQMYTTQLYLNILEFRRNRLRRLGLVCNYESARKNYSGSGKGISKKSYFDGKYEITEVSEDIAARTSYLKDGRKIYTRTDKQIAAYNILSAKLGDSGRYVCPNCGVPETRENLLDGCDSCGTKFIIEDLGPKINDFGYRSDYNVQYEKYKEVRTKMALWVTLIFGIFFFVYCLFWTLKITPDIVAEEHTGPFMTIMMVLFTALFPTAGFTFICVFLFYFFVFPWIQIGASATYMTKRRLNKLKNAYKDDKDIQEKVRQYDPLFSVQAFYSGVQNKLSSIHFSETPNQINAFTAFDLSGMLEKYRNVVDMDTDYISLRNYYVDPQSQLQVAEVEVNLRLTELRGEKCKTRVETVMLMLTKSAACKTQSVCAPTLLRCRGCGSGLTLLNGRVCPQCGTDIYLERYDWIVRGYKAK